MMAVTAIHQRRAKAVAKVGAMAVLSRREDYERTGEHTRTEMVFLRRRKSRAKRQRERMGEKKSQMKMRDCNITDMHFFGF